MYRNTVPPFNSLNNDNIKGKHKPNQEQTIFHYLQNNVATNTMVSAATGIPQKNICRFKRDMEKRGFLFELYKDLCQITGFKAWYLTTSKDKLNDYKHNKTV